MNRTNCRSINITRPSRPKGARTLFTSIVCSHCSQVCEYDYSMLTIMFTRTDILNDIKT